MTGVEYVVLHVQDPILYVIRKQHRLSPTQGDKSLEKRKESIACAMETLLLPLAHVFNFYYQPFHMYFVTNASSSLTSQSENLGDTKFSNF